jgi:hypothetical protein
MLVNVGASGARDVFTKQSVSPDVG